ncbi:MAG: hypothetical protein IJK51_00260 [Bacteroidaceae bacterium]|nr:hypothetical protein [Bacteroidaceae bacterium]
MTAMLQVVFMTIGLSVLTFVIAFIFRKWQRTILWATALLLFIGTSILLGIGLLKIYENGMVNHAVLLGITLAYACSFIFIYGAEKINKVLHQNCSTLETSIVQPVQVVNEEPIQPEQAFDEKLPQPEHEEVEEHVELQGRLNTPLARQVFALAIENGLMEEVGNHYKWNESKALLAYMCGRIYCGDYPKYSAREVKSYWKPGRTEFFPESDLNALFQETALGQSRQNRKGEAVPMGSKKVDELFE